MPVDPLSLALMAVNVGASVFNNWRNNKQSHKLQEKQQEFARAAVERNKQRMWQLMREGQELALEMERETHENRIENIRNDFDSLLHRLAYIEAIKTWPLKVLPIVMKNQSLGSLTATADENIAMHCILTPSNCARFNEYIYPVIEDKLADFCNLHWSTHSSHPILFYSGAWKTGTIPTGVEISQLKTNLSNLPTLLITPFFKPEGGIEFQINAWGIGVELETEIECAEFSYAERYERGIDYLQEEDIKERTIEEFIPYLQCLIGYIADQYFWTNHNEPPILPTLLAMKVVNTDGMQYLNIASEERYSDFFNVCMEESRIMPFALDKILSLFEGSAVLLNESTRKEQLGEIIALYCGRFDSDINDIKQITSHEWMLSDICFLRRVLPYMSDELECMKDHLEYLESIDEEYSILSSKNETYLKSLVEQSNALAMYRLGELYEYGMKVKINERESYSYYKKSAENGFPLAKVKVGILSFNDLDERYVQNLRSVQVIQVDVLYSDYIINHIKDHESISSAIVLVANNLLAQKNRYAHYGIIYNLAKMRIINNEGIHIARSFLQMLVVAGYEKANKLLTTLK